MSNKMRYPDKWLTRRRFKNVMFDITGYILAGTLILAVCMALFIAGRESVKSDGKIEVRIPAVNTVLVKEFKSL